MVLMVRSFFLKSFCQGTETDLNGATTFHAAAICTALLLVSGKIPMEIQMRITGVKNPGQRETQRVVNPAKREGEHNIQLQHNSTCFWIYFPVCGAHFFRSKSQPDNLDQSPAGKMEP